MGQEEKKSLQSPGGSLPPAGGIFAEGQMTIA
jgi:hypothetical protein